MIIRKEIRFVALYIPKKNQILPDRRHIHIMPKHADGSKLYLCEVGPSSEQVRMIYRRCLLPDGYAVLSEWRHWLALVGIAYLKGPLYREDFGFTGTVHL